MKTFKCVKKYPGGPEIGKEQLVTQTYDFLHLYPEFWKEIVEKDYEILSFICTADLNSLKKGIIVNRIENSYLFESEDLRINDVESKFLEIPHWNIYSVKRLSDGEIFTIGDKIGMLGFSFPIAEFKINNNENTILVSSYFNKNNSGSYNHRLKDIQKVKQPLFKTEDGVGIFEGDTYSYVNPLFSTFHIKAYADHNVREGLKMFSTEEKAKEYVLMNKKLLSVEDVLSVWSELSGNSRESLLSQSILMFRIIKFLKNK